TCCSPRRKFRSTRSCTSTRRRFRPRTRPPGWRSSPPSTTSSPCRSSATDGSWGSSPSTTCWRRSCMADPATPAGAIRAARSRWARLFAVLAVIGPGIITANVDNDAGGIATYSQAGAAFGYSLLWTLIPITVALIVVQEMCARMGAVTGKGLSDLIRERFGVRWTIVAMLALLIANGSNVAAEFAGVAASLELVGVQRIVSVPLAGLAIWALVVFFPYRVVERTFFVLVLAFIAYPVSAVIVHPDWGSVAQGLTAFHLPNQQAALVAALALVGTTITPYMQFYIQASIVDKGI